MASSSAELLRELHSDLSRRYNTHITNIEDIWQTLDGPQRAGCFEACAADGVVLRHPEDESLGVANKIIPELNIEDIAKPGSDYLLHHLKHRATVPLSEQYRKGVGGKLGDHGFIIKKTNEKQLLPKEEYENNYTLFFEDKTYGNSIEIVSNSADSLSGLAPAIRAQLIVPQSVGELIIERQTLILQSLIILIEDILETG